MTSWESLKPTTEDGFGEIVDTLHGEWSQIRSDIGFSSTAFFPLNAYLSLDVGGPYFEEDVVLSVSVQNKGPISTFSSEIADGAGNLLVVGPGDTWPATLTVGAQVSRALLGLESYFTFVAEHVDVVRQVLRCAAEQEILGS